MNYCALKEVYEQTLIWEKDLLDLYDAVKTGFTDRLSLKLICDLVADQESNFRVLKIVDIAACGREEWLENAPAFDADAVPHKEISRDSKSGDITQHILECQEKLKRYYSDLQDVVCYKEHKDLFGSLALLKDRQIAVLRTIREKMSDGE